MNQLPPVRHSVPHVHLWSRRLLLLVALAAPGIASCAKQGPSELLAAATQTPRAAQAPPAASHIRAQATAIPARPVLSPAQRATARATYVAEVDAHTPLPTWEPKPTSTRYTSDDVMNDIVSCCNWADLAWDPDVIVSATFGAELPRTVRTRAHEFPESPVALPTSFWYTRHMEVTVTEVFKGGPQVQVGDTLVVSDSHPDNEMHAIVEYGGWRHDHPEPGNRYLFFLIEDPEDTAHGPGHYYGYPVQRLLVTADGLWIATPERNRMISVMDTPGPVFLDQLRNEIVRVQELVGDG